MNVECRRYYHFDIRHLLLDIRYFHGLSTIGCNEVRSLIVTGFPLSILFLAATPINTDIVPSRLPAAWRQGSAPGINTCLRKRTSPPPCPASSFGMRKISRLPKLVVSWISSNGSSCQGCFSLIQASSLPFVPLKAMRYPS